MTMLVFGVHQHKDGMTNFSNLKRVTNKPAHQIMISSSHRAFLPFVPLLFPLRNPRTAKAAIRGFEYHSPHVFVATKLANLNQTILLEPTK